MIDPLGACLSIEKRELDPLQDRNSPNIVNHYERMGRCTGDPMLQAKVLLIRKGRFPWLERKKLPLPK